MKRLLSTASMLTAAALAIGVMPAGTANAGQATAVAADRGELVEKNCRHDQMAVGYFKRARKDAICLRPGTRTWSGMTIYECAGKVVVHLEGSGKQNCGIGLNFKKGVKVVKTVARL